MNYFVNYTFGRALGIRSGNSSGASGDPFKPSDNYGALPYDRHHILNAAFIFALPEVRGANRLARTALNGWQVSGTTSFQSGVNLQAAGSANFGLTARQSDGTLVTNQEWLGTNAAPIQPLVTCNPTNNRTAGSYIDGNCFSLPAFGQQGDYVFPDIRGPAFFSSDLSLFKNYAIREGRTLQLRLSAFNFLNHPLPTFGIGENTLNLNFDAAGKLATQNFGVPQGKVGGRVIQLALKFSF
jgi:hypothetical protein